ncbi:MAG: helix-turn-helix domain-containing protein [Rothia sp. (in: high G+C Gram-positive bacteria)]|nr:helix-turn-helix domain-containing protein [Rothia sp. (in: high G+C Gram-positive bacteria)]
MTSHKTSPSRSAGRPLASLLTLPKITLAAQELLAKNGDFTMAKLAKKLGVAPSSLYNHVSSRDDVLAALSDRVAQGISTKDLKDAATQVSDTKLSKEARRKLWVSATSAWARSYRQAFALSPALVAALAVTPVRQAPATLAMYEEVTAAFTAFGWKPRQALLTVEAIEAFLLGAATDTHAPADIFDPGRQAPDHPIMTAGFRELGQSPHDEAFELGLAALLTGLSLSIC